MDRIKKRVFNIWFVLIFMLFLLPYLGGVGQLVFEPLGKYYYAIVFCVCAVNFAVRFFLYKDSVNLKYFDKRYFKKTKKTVVYVLIFLAVLLIGAICVLFGYSSEDGLFGAVLLSLFVYFSTYRYDDTLRSAISVTSTLYLYFIVISSLIGERFSYFNPNSYALFLSVLFFFSALYSGKSPIWKILSYVNFIVTICTVQFIYKTETQTITVFFFFVLLLLKNRLLNGGAFTKLLLFYLFAFTVLLPFLSALLYRAGFVDGTFFSNRAEVWKDAIERIFNAGIFHAAGTEQGEIFSTVMAHNGFLDICVKYTLPVAVAAMAGLIFLYFKLSSHLRNNRFRQTAFAAILAFVLMNSVESVFVGLCDGYFMLFISGMLLSDVADCPNKEDSPLPPVDLSAYFKKLFHKKSDVLANGEGDLSAPAEDAKNTETDRNGKAETNDKEIESVEQSDLRGKSAKKSRSIAGNALAKAILNICNIIVPVIVGPYVLRVLDREYYDLYTSLNSVFQFFLIFGALGVYNYGVREISKIRDDRDKCNAFFTEQFIIGVASNILTLLVYIVVCFFTEEQTLSRILCIVMSAQLFGNVFNVEWMNEAHEDYLFIAVKSILVKLLYFVGIFVLVRRFDDIVAYVALLTGAAVLNTSASFVHIKKRCKFVFKGLNIRRHLFPVFNTFVIVNVMLFYAQFDKLMLRWFSGDGAVTAYQIPQYVSSLCYSVVIAVVTVTIPRVSNLFAGGAAEEANALHRSSSNLFLMIMIPLTVGLCLLSNEVIYLYGGAGYADCVRPLCAYSVLQFVSGFHYMVGEAYIYVRGDEKVLLFINIFGAALNVGLNFLCVALDKFTPLTAVITLIVAYVAISAVDILFVRKKYAYRYGAVNKHTLLYLCAAAIFIPVVILLKRTALSVIPLVLICVVSCAVIYFALLAAFKDEYFLSLFKKVKNIFVKIAKRGRTQ